MSLPDWVIVLRGGNVIAVSYRLIGTQGRGLISSMDPAHAWVKEPVR